MYYLRVQMLTIFVYTTYLFSKIVVCILIKHFSKATGTIINWIYMFLSYLLLESHDLFLIKQGFIIRHLKYK